MPVLNLVVAVLRDRLLLLSLSVERFVLTLINEDYYYYYVANDFKIRCRKTIRRLKQRNDKPLKHVPRPAQQQQDKFWCTHAA